MPPSANCRDHIRIKATLRHDLTAPPSAEKVAPVGLYQSESFMGQHDAAGMVPTIILLCIELGCIGNVLSTCRHWLACLHYEKQVRMAYYRAMLLRPFWDDVNTRIGKVGENVDEDWGRCPERVVTPRSAFCVLRLVLTLNASPTRRCPGKVPMSGLIAPLAAAATACAYTS